MSKLVRRKEVLDVLKIDKMLLYRLIASKKIEAIKVGSKYLYNLDKYLADNNISLNTNSKETNNNKLRKKYVIVELAVDIKKKI